MEYLNILFEYSLNLVSKLNLLVHLYCFLFEISGVNLLLCIEFFETILILTKNFRIMSDVAAKVKAIIVDKLGVDESEVTLEASFTNDLGADSLDTVELIMEFEKEFDLAIPDDQAEKISTVGEAIKHIEENLK
jgi:acyl carrier protein